MNFDNDEIPDWEDTPLKKSKTFKTLVIARQQAAAQEKEAATAKKDYSDKLFAILQGAGVERVRVDGAPVSIVTTERNSLQEGELKKALLEHRLTKAEIKSGGLSLDTIQSLWEKCVRKSTSSYVKVTEPKS
jgi:hypothetical protein